MHDHHHIQLRSNYMSTKHALDPELGFSDDEYMIIFRDSDIDKRPSNGHTELRRSGGMQGSCRSHELHFNSDPQQTVLKRNVGSWGATPINSLFGKRQIDTGGIPAGGNSGSVNLKSTIGNSAGCPTTRKVALIGVATDCTYTGSFNSSETAHSNVITQINSASNVYESTFNISLGLQNLTVSDATCPGTPAAATPWNTGCGGNTSITDRLNTFSQWRGENPDNNAYWTLLTTCQTGAEVGLSWLGQLCVNNVMNSSGEVVSGANVVAKTSTEWQVIAHESGHTFGAVHDCDSQTCASSETVNSQQCCPLSTTTCDAGSKYIMNPYEVDGISAFSACTVGNICSALGRNSVSSSCLSDNRGVTTITGQQCGNGIVEEGEDCDCGGTANCDNNTCCDATTCKFKNGAVCDPSNEDCCINCQLSGAGTVCRASTGQCDPQETCSGTNATCPPDVSAPNGQTCGNSSQSLQCASGQCTSRDQQCKTLMGSYTTKNDTYACNSQDCTLSCASPEFGLGVCYSMQQNFLDGTVCGGGGKCTNVSIITLSSHFPTHCWSSTRANAKVQLLPKRLVAGFTTIVILLSVYAVALAVSCCFRSLAALYDAVDALGSRVEPSQWCRPWTKDGEEAPCRRAHGWAARSRDRDVAALGMEATKEVRNIHRLDMCSLVCDMLKLGGMGRTWGLHCICIGRRWIMWAKSHEEHRP